MKHFFLSLTVAIATLCGMFGTSLYLASAAHASDVPTLHYDGSSCSLGDKMNIDALQGEFDKIKASLNVPEPRLIYLSGDELTQFDKRSVANGGQPKPAEIVAVVFILYKGYDDTKDLPVTALFFDAHGCFLAGKVVPSVFVIRGLGQTI